MEHPLFITNSLTRNKEQFVPANAPFVGMYVCGPTVYGPPHLGHARPYITFDVLFRYLHHLGYKTRYVRNITDVGHLVDDSDDGEDKIAKKARIEKLEPMEVAKMYTDSFHEAMRVLNNLPPSIEPSASGHIIEQIEMIRKIMDKGLAYESGGSVYFDVIKYGEDNDYGKLSGRIPDELIAGAGNERRELEGQDEKRHAADFALWKKADPAHIMKWPSPWSMGFPGWHIECSAMSVKYLGDTFDIHGGGMDLLFPHHESEIAQSKGSCGKAPVRYWMHNNMITINGRKMGKSLGNFINLEEFFTGKHKLLTKAYSPMTVRFYMLQAHYRSTLDFSNEALQSAEKAFAKLVNSYQELDRLKPGDGKESVAAKISRACYDAMNDDLNTAIALSHLFDASRHVNAAASGERPLAAADIEGFRKLFDELLFGVLGMRTDEKTGDGDVEGLMDLVLSIRAEAKARKDFSVSDKIRDELTRLNFVVKDGKDGATWSKG